MNNTYDDSNYVYDHPQMLKIYNKYTKVEMAIAVAKAEGKGIEDAMRLMRYRKETLCRVVFNDHPKLRIKKFGKGATVQNSWGGNSSGEESFFKWILSFFPSTFNGWAAVIMLTSIIASLVSP